MSKTKFVFFFLFFVQNQIFIFICIALRVHLAINLLAFRALLRVFFLVTLI